MLHKRTSAEYKSMFLLKSQSLTNNIYSRGDGMEIWHD